jgi:hypothetical protein
MKLNGFAPFLSCGGAKMTQNCLISWDSNVCKEISFLFARNDGSPIVAVRLLGLIRFGRLSILFDEVMPMAPAIPPEWLVGIEDAPDEVKAIITKDPRRPETDPTLGIPVGVNLTGTPRHRLVTIGDSLTQGFQSGAIYNTNLSFPVMIARELGWNQFRYPPVFGGPGNGLPLNLEKLVRELGDRYQIEDGVNALDVAVLLPWLRGYLDKVEDYWERGAGSKPPETGPINHNLGVYGWDLRNTISRTAQIAKTVIQSDPPKDDFLSEIPEHAQEITTQWVLNTARNATGQSLSPVQAAAVLSQAGTVETGQGDGIETLIVLIGSNNALGSILTFNVVWSGEDYMDMSKNDKYTVWIPSHFKAELNRLVEEVKKIKARHVIWGTVPHVTIVPFARGINKDQKGQKVRPGSRYYPIYAPFWFNEENFSFRRSPKLTENQVRAIDSVIDQYNQSIVEAVRQARQQGRDWYVFETVALLDRLAQRRYIEDPAARPDWWKPYPLPAPLSALNPKPTSNFFISNENGRKSGGLFSLDGIHPTTIGYGILAQELIKVMQRAGVKFYRPDGTERTGPVTVDFNRLIQEDTLISNPPPAGEAVVNFVGWLDSLTGIISQMYKSSI